MAGTYSTREPRRSVLKNSLLTAAKIFNFPVQGSKKEKKLKDMMIGNPKILTEAEYRRVVEAALGDADFQVVAVREARLGTRVGFLADHSRVQVDVERRGERLTLPFFAKALPSNDNCRAMVEESGSWEREQFFYDVLSKHLEQGASAKAFPTCYLSKPEVLILEDLAPQGYGPVGSTHEAVDLGHCRAVLEGLARFHCGSIAAEERLQRSLRDVYPEHMYEVLFKREGRAAVWWRVGLAAARALVPLLDGFKDQPALARRVQDRFQGLGAELLQCLQCDPQRRNVMCHGDAWVSNFLFKYSQGKPDQAVLLDFQLMRYAPPVFDAQLFLHKSLGLVEGRAQLQADLLQFYHKRLQAELRAAGLDAAAVLPDAEFAETSRLAGRFCTIVVALYCQACDMPVDFIESMFADADLYNKFMFTEARAEHVLDKFRTDKHFRRAMGNAVADLAEMLLADGL